MEYVGLFTSIKANGVGELSKTVWKR